MAVGATNLIKHLLALLYASIVEVTCTWNSQTTMPYHKVVELVCRHLWLEVVPFVVKLVSARLKQILYLCSYLIVGTCPERRCWVFLYLLNHLLVGSHCCSPSISCVKLRTVGTCHVGDVPDGIGSRSVLKCGTCQGIGETLNHLLAFLAVGILTSTYCCCIPCAVGKVVGIGIPEVGVNVFAHISHLCYVLIVVGCRGILSLEVVLGNGIEQTSTHHANSRLHTHGNSLVACVIGVRTCAEGRARDCHLRIDERILLAIGELHWQSAFHSCYLMPL